MWESKSYDIYVYITFILLGIANWRNFPPPPPLPNLPTSKRLSGRNAIGTDGPLVIGNSMYHP